MRKFGYISILIIAFAVLQPSLLFFLGRTIYMHDIVAVIVAAQSFTRSMRLSAVIAISAGIVVDLASPATGIFGVSSISYLLIALFVNRYAAAPHDSAWKPVLTAALAPAAAVIVRAVVLLLTMQSISLSQLPAFIGWQLITGAIFATFLVPIIDLIDKPLYRDSLPLRVRA